MLAPFRSLPRSRPTHLVAALLLVALLEAPRPAQADTFTWTQLSGGNASGSWNTAANWNSGAGPVAGGADNTADFSTLDLTAASTVMLDGDQTIGHLIFGDIAGPPSNWTLNAGAPPNSTLSLAATAGSSTIDVSAGQSVTINPRIEGTAGLTKQGDGTLTLAGSNKFLGDTAVDQGTLFLSNSLTNSVPSSKKITVAAGAELNVTGLAGAAQRLTLVSGQTLAGSGTVTGNLTVASGSVISPGASPGTLTVDGDQTWAGGGHFIVDIQSVGDGTQSLAGQAGGWNMIAATGAITINAAGSNQFRVLLNSLDPSGSPGEVSDFAYIGNYFWKIADSTAPIVGYTTPQQFAVYDTPVSGLSTGFQNVNHGLFRVLLGTYVPGGDNTELYVHYSGGDIFPDADFDDDGDSDSHDLDILWNVIRPEVPGDDDPGSNDFEDLNADGFVNEDDVDYMLAEWLNAGPNRQYGDADLDGGVGGLDYTAWRNRAGTGWAHGDFDGDGGVGGLDYTLWRTRPTAYPTTVGPHSGARIDSVPEPGALTLAALAAILALALRSRRSLLQ